MKKYRVELQPSARLDMKFAKDVQHKCRVSRRPHNGISTYYVAYMQKKSLPLFELPACRFR